jgi:hypothetical protein
VIGVSAGAPPWFFYAPVFLLSLVLRYMPLKTLAIVRNDAAPVHRKEEASIVCPSTPPGANRLKPNANDVA